MKILFKGAVWLCSNSPILEQFTGEPNFAMLIPKKLKIPRNSFFGKRK